ncbi:MAG: carbohydrate kinase family protein [Candidatus Roizmanbacteria bacterium]|nr:carbohydrate kinase family protein [Candidatus Roizmanbacteria bacterium]
MYDVITIGGATLDVFLSCHNFETIEHNGQKQIAFPAGAKINVEQALFEAGGGGTNTATTFARQRLKAAVIAKTGNDFAGAQVLKKLTEEHVDTQYLVQDPNDTTDFSTIIWAPMKGSVILVNRGKGKLELSDIDWRSLPTRWFHISSIEGNVDIVEQIGEVCSSSNGKSKIAWNPGKKELEKRDEVMGALSCVELLITNKSEIQSLLDFQSDTINEILQKAQHLPCRSVIITDGHSGSHYWNGKNWKHAGIYEVERQEATGAGDAFGAGFVTGLIKGYSEDDCLKLATANAASVVTAPSAKKGILTEEQAKDWMGKELGIKNL